MGTANQNIQEEHEGDHVLPLQERQTYGFRSHDAVHYVSGEDQHCQNCPSPGAHPLTSHRVVPAGAVEQHAAYEPNSNRENACAPAMRKSCAPKTDSCDGSAKVPVMGCMLAAAAGCAAVSLGLGLAATAAASRSGSSLSRRHPETRGADTPKP
eukprot:scaffold22351_cov66-Phaeocystis_antarctica.AAC.4